MLNPDLSCQLAPDSFKVEGCFFFILGLIEGKTQACPHQPGVVGNSQRPSWHPCPCLRGGQPVDGAAWGPVDLLSCILGLPASSKL